MYPLLVFASGLVAGAVGASLLKSSKTPAALAAATRSGAEQAQAALRDATVSGLAAVEKGSASLRGKLEGEAVTPADPVQAAPDTAAPAATQ